MVGQRFMENMIDLDKNDKCTLATFCEEKRAAYNRVKLTSYFETMDPSDLSMTEEYNEDGSTPWFEENNVELYLNDLQSPHSGHNETGLPQFAIEVLGQF